MTYVRLPIHIERVPAKVLDWYRNVREPAEQQRDVDVRELRPQASGVHVRPAGQDDFRELLERDITPEEYVRRLKQRADRKIAGRADQPAARPDPRR